MATLRCAGEAHPGDFNVRRRRPSGGLRGAPARAGRGSGTAHGAAGHVRRNLSGQGARGEARGARRRFAPDVIIKGDLPAELLAPHNENSNAVAPKRAVESPERGENDGKLHRHTNRVHLDRILQFCRTRFSGGRQNWRSITRGQSRAGSQQQQQLGQYAVSHTACSRSCSALSAVVVKAVTCCIVM